MYLSLLATVTASILSIGGAQPNLQPAVASVPGLTAIVFGNGNSIWISTSKDNGRHFSPPSEVARVSNLMLGRHRGPRVAISGSTVIVTAVNGVNSGDDLKTNDVPSHGDLVAWRSEDGGQLWAKPVTINDVSRSAREGLHAFAVAATGQLAAVWLDLRVPGTRLMGAFSNDGGRTWSRNTLLYEAPGGSICQCCAPSIAFDQAGRASVMFRNIADGTRDMYVLGWTPGQRPSEPHKAGTGSWTINACPMDGGGIARKGDVTVTAWRRDKTVYVTQSGKEEVAVGEGKDVAVTMGPRGAYVAWTGRSGLELYEPKEKTVRLLSPSGTFAAISGLSDGSVLVAWEDAGRIQIETVQ